MLPTRSVPYEGILESALIQLEIYTHRYQSILHIRRCSQLRFRTAVGAGID
jgi:hypothetical protein